MATHKNRSASIAGGENGVNIEGFASSRKRNGSARDKALEAAAGEY